MANTTLQGVSDLRFGSVAATSAIDRYFNFLGNGAFGGGVVVSGYTVPADTGSTHYGAIANSETCVPNFAGSITGLSCRLTIRNERMVPTTIKVHVNGSDTTCLLTIGAFETGFFTGTGTASFTSGQRVQAHMESAAMDITAAGYVGDDMDLSAVWCDMTSTTTKNSIMRADVHGPRSSATLTDSALSINWGVPASGYDFVPIPIAGCLYQYLTSRASNLGEITDNATLEAPLKMTVRAAGTYSGMRCFIPINSADETINIYFRKNGANGNGTITILALEAGEFTASGTDAVVSGDLINYAMIHPMGGGGGGNTKVRSVWCNFAATSNEFGLFATFQPDSGTIAQYTTNGGQFGAMEFSGEHYFGVMGTNDTGGGGDQTPGTSNTVGYPDAYRAYVDLPSTYQFYSMRVYCDYHDDAPITFGTFINDNYGNQKVIIDGTGLFEHTYDSGDESTYDEISGCRRLLCYYAKVQPGTTGYAQISHASMSGATLGEASSCDDGWDTCDHECDEALTLSEMVVRTFTMLGEDYANPAYWTWNEIERYVQSAYVEACRETKAVEYIEAVALTADDELAYLSDYVGQIFRATWDDYKIENTTKWELDRREHDWENQSGYVSNYVTTLQDNRTIRTYKAWDGTTYNAEDLFYNDGAYTYAAWANGAVYDPGHRRTVTTDGVEKGYYCILSHTAVTATNKPGSGTSWETYWTPISLMIWATKHPGVLGFCEEPELPPWSHLSLCYAAASRALGKHGEQRNEDAAAAYRALADEYWALLKGHVANRTPERVVAMGSGYGRRGIRKPRPYDQVVS